MYQWRNLSFLLMKALGSLYEVIYFASQCSVASFKLRLREVH